MRRQGLGVLCVLHSTIFFYESHHCTYTLYFNRRNERDDRRSRATSVLSMETIQCTIVEEMVVLEGSQQLQFEKSLLSLGSRTKAIILVIAVIP